ncbi:myrosinase 1-like [Frankliniella occidentalis]|uniref:Myrosinase 1-like n=1 Tax=Frankliniella occidentalis TaxID=133901 RepID=A0A6J1TIX4_FRAOC|nr:myrosinase 1-like [Frankliniella occidentalis]
MGRGARDSVSEEQRTCIEMTETSMLITHLALACCLAGASGRLLTAEDSIALPKGLLIGAGVSAVQTEGAWNEDGKAESSVDYLIHQDRLSSLGLTNPHGTDIAANSYHRFKEDVKMAARLKLKAFRFSFSWPRILPTSDASKPNDVAVKHYHDLVDEILYYNMTPLATLYHFDHPQSLESFNSWFGYEMVEHFVEYAKFVFKEYGSKVKMWSTINEPNILCTFFPLLYRKAGFKLDTEMDHLVCQRHALLAHARAYREFKKLNLSGQVGLSLALLPAIPRSTRADDIYAAYVLNEMFAGILYNPIVYGDYPQVAKKVAAGRLPLFSEEEKILLNGTADFLGFNIYNGLTAYWQTPDESSKKEVSVPLGPTIDLLPFVQVDFPNMVGNDTADFYEKAKPDAIRETLIWVWQNYKKPIVVSENGFGDCLGHGKKDQLRAAYHSAFLRELVITMTEFKIEVLAYCAWSLIDAWEFTSEYRRPFGLIHIDYENGTLDRSLKDSAWFWIEMAETGVVPTVEVSSTSHVIPGLFLTFVAFICSQKC